MIINDEKTLEDIQRDIHALDPHANKRRYDQRVRRNKYMQRYLQGYRARRDSIKNKKNI